jgi:ABC-type lipoprotein release transport system permease subunit
MLGGVLKGLLFGVEPHSPVLLMSVAAGLLLIASAATGLPAARAASVDPARVLREE